MTFGDDTLEVSVVMPCLNEAETLEACIRKAQEAIQKHRLSAEIIVANNGSTDGSKQIAERCDARVVSVADKGYGNALRGGIDAARGRFVIMGDADDSYDFSDLYPFVEKLREGYDLVWENALARSRLQAEYAAGHPLCDLAGPRRANGFLQLLPLNPWPRAETIMDWHPLLAKFHADYVFNRRTQVLADRIATLLPSGRILDVGCGDGTIDALLHERRKDLEIQGVDIIVRPIPRIPVTQLHHLPFPDRTLDAVLLVDVLHHMTDCVPLLRECAQVGKSVVLKDHLCESRIDWILLKLMDWVGNRPHGAVLAYNYLSQRSREKLFDAVGLQMTEKITAVPLYPLSFSLVFGRRLHFIAGLSPGFPGDQSLPGNKLFSF